MKAIKTYFLTILTLVFSTVFVNAQTEPTVTLEFKNADAAQKLAQGYLQGWKDMDVSKLQKNLSEKAMIYGLGSGADSLTVAQHKEFLTENMKSYTYGISNELYLPVKVTNNWNEGEWVLCWGINTVTNKKTGKKSEVPYHIAVRTENGKDIDGVYYYYDSGNLLATQGWTITPPKGK